MRRLVDDPVVLSEAALKLLNTRFSNTCMLPKLRNINWVSLSPGGRLVTPMLPLIVSPVLTHFRLKTHYSGDAPYLVSALEALAPAYDSLVEIRVSCTIHDPRVIDATSTLLLKCNPKKLRYFNVDSTLSNEAFIRAAQLPNLEKLVIRTDAAELSLPLPTSMFPSLISLEVNTTDTTPSPLLQTVTYIQSEVFQRLHLNFPAAALGTFLPTTISALQPRGLHQMLTTLSISPTGHFDLDIASIRSLLCLTQLNDLRINFRCSRNRCPYKLSDGDLRELVKAMPKLQLLSLGSFPCSHPANNTLKSLITIANHCKHLDELVIHTNVGAVINELHQRRDWGHGWTPEDPLSAFIGCPVRSIMFGSCPIPHDGQGAIVFALILLRLFPRLNSVEAACLVRDPLWEVVQHVIATHGSVGAELANVGK